MSAEIENALLSEVGIVQVSLKGQEKPLTFFPIDNRLTEKIGYPPLCEVFISTGAMFDLADTDETKSDENIIRILSSLRQTVLHSTAWETSGYVSFETPTTRGIKKMFAIPNLKPRSGSSIWIIGGLIPKNQTVN